MTSCSMWRTSPLLCSLSTRIIMRFAAAGVTPIRSATTLMSSRMSSFCRAIFALRFSYVFDNAFDFSVQMHGYLLAAFSSVLREKRVIASKQVSRCAGHFFLATFPQLVEQGEPLHSTVTVAIAAGQGHALDPVQLLVEA